MQVGDLVIRSKEYAQYCVCGQRANCWCRDGQEFEVRSIKEARAQGGAVVDVRHWGRMLWHLSVAWFAPVKKIPVRKKVPVRRHDP